MDPNNTPQFTPNAPSPSSGQGAPAQAYDPYQQPVTQGYGPEPAYAEPAGMPQNGSYNPNTPMQPPAQYGAPAAPVTAPHLKSNPNSTQNSLQIAEIRDGIVIMNDGSFRSVVMV